MIMRYSKCSKKKKRTKDEAYKELCVLNRNDEHMGMYKCVTCGHYHLGHLPIEVTIIWKQKLSMLDKV